MIEKILSVLHSVLIGNRRKININIYSNKLKLSFDIKNEIEKTILASIATKENLPLKMQWHEVSCTKFYDC